MKYILFLTICLMATAAQAQNTSLAVRKAQAQEKYYSDKYGLDAAQRKLVYNHFYQKEMELDKSGMSDSQLQLLTNRFDSIENNLLHAIKSKAFLKNRIETLNGIQVLPNHQQEQLQQLFFQLCQSSAENSYADNFTQAMHMVVSDTVYYAHLYRTDINAVAGSNTGKALYDITKKYRLPKETNGMLQPILLQREKALTTLDYTFPAYTKQKDSLVAQVKQTSDSLLAMALMKEGIFLNNSKFSYAIKNKKYLELKNEQVDTLMLCAMELDKKIADYALQNPLARYNAAPYEAARIPVILTEDQYTKLLEFLYKPKAEEWAKSDWTELSERGLATGLNRDYVVRQITRYNANRLAIKEKYANDPATMNLLVAGLDQNMPDPLRKLKTARSREKAQAARDGQTQTQTQTKPVRGSFQW